MKHRHMSDEELDAAIQRALADHPDKVAGLEGQEREAYRLAAEAWRSVDNNKENVKDNRDA